jgi:hypothetical protein
MRELPLILLRDRMWALPSFRWRVMRRLADFFSLDSRTNVPAESTSPSPSPERFFGRKESSPLPPTPTPGRRPPWSLVRGGLMDWYLDKFRYLPVSGLKINGWYKFKLEHTFEVHQKYIRYILNGGGNEGIIFFFLLSYPLFLNRQGESRAIPSTKQNWF